MVRTRSRGKRLSESPKREDDSSKVGIKRLKLIVENRRSLFDADDDEEEEKEEEEQEEEEGKSLPMPKSKINFESKQHGVDSSSNVSTGVLKSPYFTNGNTTLTMKTNKKETLSSDSDSSSDEFVRAPFSLNDLGEFHSVVKHEDADASNIKSSHLNAVSRLSDDSDEETSTKTNEYFDFSQIIQTQSRMSNIAQNRCTEEDKNDMKRSVKKLSLSKNTRNPRKDMVKEQTLNPHSLSSSVDVLKLLALGEPTHENKNDSGDTASHNEKEINIPKDGIQVTINMPDELVRRKKKGEFDVEAAMKRRFNLIKKENQVLVHKVHLLCWLAHGNYVNNVLNSQELMAVSLSLIPSQHCYPPKYADLAYLGKLVEWFYKKIKFAAEESDFNLSLVDYLKRQLDFEVANSKRDLVLLFVCIVRSLGLKARLILSLQPLPLKPSSDDLCTVASKSVKGSSNNTKIKESSSKTETERKVTEGKTGTTNKKYDKDAKIIQRSKKKLNKKYLPKTVKSNKISIDEEHLKQCTSATSSNSLKQVDKLVESGYFSGSSEVDQKNSTTTSKFLRPQRVSKLKKSSYFENSDEDDQSLKKQIINKADLKTAHSCKKSGKINHLACENKTNKNVNPERSSLNKSRAPDVSKIDSSDDSDFEPPKRKNKGKKDIDRRVLSSDTDTEKKGKKRIGNNVWAEVFLEAEEKWISVDITTGKVHCVQQLHAGATQPVLYVLGWNNDGSVKDVTRRYVTTWMTVTRRARVDAQWWAETIAPYLPARTPQEKEEDEDLDRQIHDQPLPTSVSEYKNHPMYALSRHLLKFQALYPAEPVPMGFVRGEPVYARSCVTELHSRETWIKQAKVVRLGEKPYKIVKARPKYDKLVYGADLPKIVCLMDDWGIMEAVATICAAAINPLGKLTGGVINNLPLELFGHWQVDEYIPPPAVDGKVPRNEYGNVELYKACMLPKGTVHLQVPGLNRVARKLNIDCAPAVVGWEFHSGGSHPTFDGFVVCEEFKDSLLDAWNQEIDESAKRAKEKLEARIYGNWKRLIKGLMIRERLQAKYNFGSTSSQDNRKKKSSKR